jgi:hypothetical protein
VHSPSRRRGPTPRLVGPASEPKRVLFAGDTPGNAAWVARHVFTTATTPGRRDRPATRIASFDVLWCGRRRRSGVRS